MAARELVIAAPCYALTCSVAVAHPLMEVPQPARWQCPNLLKGSTPTCLGAVVRPAQEAVLQSALRQWVKPLKDSALTCSGAVAQPAQSHFNPLKGSASTR